MPRKRKSVGEEEQGSNDVNPTSAEVYEKGGRVLRVRDTCMCPVCGMYFSPTEIQSHAQACLYFLEHESDLKKKPKKGLSSSTNTTPSPSKTNLSKSDSAILGKSPNPDSPNTNPRPNAVMSTDWKPNTVVQWNIPYAPVFRPTVAEFKRPLEYIAKIRPVAEKYGICVIVPPYPAESWNQNIGDPKTLSFRTKVQNIHQLKTRWQGRNEVFVSNLASFLEKRGEPLRVLPRVDSRDLDLFKLFSCVVNRGGYQVVERANLWKSVADELKLSAMCVRNNTLRNHYHKYLHAYETYRKSKLQYRPATTTSGATPASATSSGFDDDLYIAEDITDDLYNTDYLEDDDPEDEFGFYEGEEYTLSAFEKKARNFSEKWFPAKPSPEQVEEEFWRIVETAEDSVKVDYGSDLDVTKIKRSGFPRDRVDGPYLTDDHTHWNLNRLPRMHGSVLSHIKETVAGVTDPMLYVGMLFSSFCWHTEDNYLYSINYMHKGTAKTWYGVPASAAEHFEEVMKAAVPDLFLKHPDLLHLLITMISPAILAENKVPIVRAVQEPGQYVITFPKAYHAGFSHGFTCAEAVNFAPADWLPYGYEAVLHYRTIKRQSVFSHEQLMCTIANRDPSPETSFWLCSELQKIREKEQSARDNLRLAGFFVQILGPNEHREEPKQCKICSYDCYLSSVSCSCAPQHVACLFHHAELCESCSSRSKFLQVLVPLNELDTLIEKTRKIQVLSKSFIDLTDDDDTPSRTDDSVPNMGNMNNITSHPQSTQGTSPTTPTKSTPNVAQAPASSAQVPGTPAPDTPAQSPTQSPTKESPSSGPSTPPRSANPLASASPPSASSPPKKGIVINLTGSSQKKHKSKPTTANPYENKIPPPPSLRSHPPANLGVSSFTAFAAKQNQSHTTSSSPAVSPAHHPPYPTTPSPSSTGHFASASSKSYYFHSYQPPGELGDGSPKQGSPSPHHTPHGGAPHGTPHSPNLSDHMQGIALNCPPSLSGYGKKPKPMHIILDSPTKV